MLAEAVQNVQSKVLYDFTNVMVALTVELLEGSIEEQDRIADGFVRIRISAPSDIAFDPIQA